ncbi:branched-chain amino acid ABC transporter ATP-binding protein/permease [Leucobacter aridicollis]|uniref:branched-chain amino acid ABC transporter ATP-binding protein/permease n=1 Tax=Leucobacter aridicollis TaxID=283878 RepID=UPI002102E510|nr:branched-chain amino acid ABC transporter ATP-binding protein/permease [Leucobacter aridicollis]UTX52418.1 branched-chain amino acid ABC transporter ATP-binding protein/permease [Leucobacter aridicollis]
MFTESVLVFIALNGIFAYSFYAVLVAGQLSLGQAGFAGIAAFVAATLAPTPASWGPVPTLIVAILIGMVVGSLAAVILGIPTMRLRGVFLAIATLGFAEGIRIFILNQSWTGGAQGMSVPKIVGPELAWVLLVVVAYWFWRQGRSRYGRALEAIREDELAARSIGIDVGRHRLAAFVSAGAIAGLYGVLWAYFMRIIAPEDFSFSTAIDGLVTAVVGGSTNFFGPILGSGFQTMLPELQRAVGIEAGWLRPFISGLLLLIVILYLPGGIASLVPRRKQKIDVAALTAAGAAPAAMRSHPAKGEVVVQLEGLAKEYGGVHAVQGVDLTIRSGDVVGLIGPNGAGKTTLVNMISGLIPPSSGSATVLGVEVGRTPVHKIAAAGVTRTFQHSKLFNRLTALENVLIGTHLVAKPTFLRRLLWLPSARRDERVALAQAARCLDRVGLVDKANVEAKGLSYGDQRRLEIARALAADPSVLILDEPAAGMNHVEAEALSELIRSLANDGLTIIFIEHNVGMVLGTCDHIAVLNFGQLLASGTPAEIEADERVIEAYLGAVQEPDADAASGSDSTTGKA